MTGHGGALPEAGRGRSAGGIPGDDQGLPRSVPLVRQLQPCALRRDARQREFPQRPRCHDRGRSGGLGRQHSRGRRVLRPVSQVGASRRDSTTEERHMAATVRAAIRELIEQTMVTMDALLEASDRELAMRSSHGCAQGKDVWALITNDIDHEKIHTGQVLEGRYESRITASPMERLVAEWLVERARFASSLVGLTDEQFNRETAPGQWTYRAVAKHVLAVEQDSLKTMAADQEASVAG